MSASRESQRPPAVKPLTRVEWGGFLARLWLDYEEQRTRSADEREAECNRSQASE